MIKKKHVLGLEIKKKNSNPCLVKLLICHKFNDDIILYVIFSLIFNCFIKNIKIKNYIFNIVKV